MSNAGDSSENELEETMKTKEQTILYRAAKLVRREADNLTDSAPGYTVNRLNEIAAELERIEDSL
jgi:hypothetical protein